MSGRTSSSEYAASKEYQSFRSSISQKRFVIESDGKEHTWVMYDYGPREVRCPLVFFPPVSGTADIFFRQIVALGAQGYRCISVSLQARDWRTAHSALTPPRPRWTIQPCGRTRSSAGALSSFWTTSAWTRCVCVCVCVCV